MKQDDKRPYCEGLGKWYSWDSPIGLGLGLISLSLSLAIILTAIGHFICLFINK